MIASVSATELAKLGKCELLIKSVSKDLVAVRAVRPKPVKQKQSLSSHDKNILRGELAHLKYESASKRLMSPEAQRKNQFYQVVYSVTVVMGLLALLAACATN